MARIKTCYMCDALATSKEHVPPKCVFPEDEKLRVNLITVPSCDKHNSKKSKCDELLRFILAAVPGTNDLAHGIISGRVMRSIDHCPSILDTLVPDLQVLQFDGNETGGFTLDEPRFQNSIAAIVRGLFFHETGKKLESDLRAYWSQMLTKDFSGAPFLEVLSKGEQMLPQNYKGFNPRVFQYALDVSKTGITSLCRLRFYEGNPIFILWKT
jgi:hypothetical protein